MHLHLCMQRPHVTGAAALQKYARFLSFIIQYQQPSTLLHLCSFCPVSAPCAQSSPSRCCCCCNSSSRHHSCHDDGVLTDACSKRHCNASARGAHDSQRTTIVPGCASRSKASARTTAATAKSRSAAGVNEMQQQQQCCSYYYYFTHSTLR